MRSARFKQDIPMGLMTKDQKIKFAKRFIKKGNIKSQLELQRVFPDLYSRLANDKDNLLGKLGIPYSSYLALMKSDRQQPTAF